MTGRDDLDELHALAESISADAHGWRERRRARNVEATYRRLETTLAEPVRRKRRHRWVAAVAVAVVALGLGVAVIVHRSTSPQAHHVAAPPPVAGVPRPVAIGRIAAFQLTHQGREPDQFSCESWFEHDENSLGPGAPAPDWHNAYLRACMSDTAGGD